MSENNKDKNNIEEKKEKHEVTTKEAYFATLNEWVKQANLSQNAMAMFPWYLITSYPQLFQQPYQQQQLNQNDTNNGWMSWVTAAPNAPTNNQNAAINNNTNNNNNNTELVRGRRVLFQYHIMDDQTQAAYINRHGGFEYIIAPFWKRTIAEIIDMLILLLFKILLTYSIVNLFDIEFVVDVDKEALHKVFEEDAGNILQISFDMFFFSTDLLFLEIFTKIVVCSYEALLTTYYNGATLGKAIMGLRIKYVEAMLPLPQQNIEQPLPPQQILQFGLRTQRQPIRALLYPAETPGLQRAFIRAFAKNMIMTLLFPMCFILWFFKSNRTVYDVITKTVVVEKNPTPIRRLP